MAISCSVYYSFSYHLRRVDTEAAPCKFARICCLLNEHNHIDHVSLIIFKEPCRSACYLSAWCYSEHPWIVMFIRMLLPLRQKVVLFWVLSTLDFMCSLWQMDLMVLNKEKAVLVVPPVKQYLGTSCLKLLQVWYLHTSTEQPTLQNAASLWVAFKTLLGLLNFIWRLIKGFEE